MDKDKKIKLWLVWDTDHIQFDQSLRAISTTEDRAKRYKTMVEKEHKLLGNQKRYKVEIEEREANHIMGYMSLKRFGENGYR